MGGGGGDFRGGGGMREGGGDFRDGGGGMRNDGGHNFDHGGQGHGDHGGHDNHGNDGNHNHNNNHNNNNNYNYNHTNNFYGPGWGGAWGWGFGLGIGLGLSPWIVQPWPVYVSSPAPVYVTVNNPSTATYTVADGGTTPSNTTSDSNSNSNTSASQTAISCSPNSLLDAIHNCDAKAVATILQQCGLHGDSALYLNLAINACGSPQIVGELLNAGINPNMPAKGSLSLPLIDAINLYESNVRLKSTNEEDSKAGLYQDIIIILMHYGANPQLADSQGRNAIQTANSYGDSELVKFLTSTPPPPAQSKAEPVAK